MSRPDRGFDSWTESRAARQGCRDCGFTLLEILVALAVLAVALAAVIRLLGQSIDTAAALRDRTVAQWVAEDRLSWNQMTRRFPAMDVTEGESEMGGRSWHWREQVSGTPVEKLRRIEVSVSLSGSDEVLARLTGFARQEP
jgi:general secretion pathway protein I